MSLSSNNEAFVTLSTKEDYGCGALVLAQSLRQVGTTKKLVVMISKTLSEHFKYLLKEFYDEVLPVEELNTNDIEHLQLLGRPELGVTLTKINCWLLVQYSKCVFMDSDTLVLKNIDHLFEREEFSAAPDAGWPDCFNSGVFVYRPSKETFRQLINFANQQNSSFDGGDQGLLNAFFSNWSRSDLSRHLPFTHNVTSNTFYSYLPAIHRYHQNIHVVHFAGTIKPWHLSYNSTNENLSGNLSSQNSIQRDFLLTWWKIFSKNILPKFSSSISTQNSNSERNELSSSNFSMENPCWSSSISNRNENDGILNGSFQHRRAWESGHIDYQGKDSFENILQKLNETIHQTDSHRTNESNTNQILPSRISPSSSPPLSREKVDFPASTKEKIIIIPLSSTSSLTNSETNEKDESNSTKGNEWTVKSTIITSHQQGLGSYAGPTRITKVVTETVASIEDIQTKIQDSTKSVENRQIEQSFDYFHWIVNKSLIALTYSISFIYLFVCFLFRKALQKHSINNVENRSYSSSSSSTQTKKSVDNREKL